MRPKILQPEQNLFFTQMSYLRLKSVFINVSLRFSTEVYTMTVLSRNNEVVPQN